MKLMSTHPTTDFNHGWHFSKLILILTPLLAVAIHSAPTGPARVQMWNDPAQDSVIHTSQR